MSPSAHNRQPWKFKLVSDEEKSKIASTLYDKYKDVKGHTASHTAGVMNEVPNLVVVYLDNEDKLFREIDILSIGGYIDEVLLLAEEKDTKNKSANVLSNTLTFNLTANVKSVKVNVNGANKKMYVCTSCLRSGLVERA